MPTIGALVGAFQTVDRRYLEFVDGFRMHDGFFEDTSRHVRKWKIFKKRKKKTF